LKDEDNRAYLDRLLETKRSTTKKKRKQVKNVAFEIFSKGSLEDIEKYFSENSNTENSRLNGYLFYLILKRNDLSLVRFFLEKIEINLNEPIFVFFDIGIDTDYKKLPLKIAIEERLSIEIIGTLLSRGTDPNQAQALCAVYESDPSLFHKYPDPLVSKNFLTGCMILRGADVNQKVLDYRSLRYRGHYCSLLHVTICELYSLVTQKAKANKTTNKEALEKLNTLTQDYLASIETLALYGIDIDYKETQYGQTVHDLIRYYKNKSDISSIFTHRTFLPLTREQKKFALQTLNHAENIIYCRAAFDKAAQRIKANQPGYAKYLNQSFHYNPNLYRKLISHLLMQQGQFHDFDIKTHPDVEKLCALEVVRLNAKEETLGIAKNLSKKAEETSFLKAEKKCYKKVADVLEESKESSKEELIGAYEKLVLLKRKEITAFSELIVQTKTVNPLETAKISQWNPLIWTAVKDNHKELNEAFGVLEQQISTTGDISTLLSSYQPPLKNMTFFTNYAMEAISGTKSHNLQRLAYCVYFLQNLSIHYEEEKATKPSVELLKNLYLLKGFLLAEVHSKNYLENLFNCAMTSRMCRHVQREIGHIEKMLRESGLVLDGDPDIIKRREQLESLDKAYGTAWRRFKTALLSKKNQIQADDFLLQERETALHNIGIKKPG
jgi:hypothetical protein